MDLKSYINGFIITFKRKPKTTIFIIILFLLISGLLYTSIIINNDQYNVINIGDGSLKIPQKYDCKNNNDNIIIEFAPLSIRGEYIYKQVFSISTINISDFKIIGTDNNYLINEKNITNHTNITAIAFGENDTKACLIEKDGKLFIIKLESQSMGILATLEPDENEIYILTESIQTMNHLTKVNITKLR